VRSHESHEQATWVVCQIFRAHQIIRPHEFFALGKSSHSIHSIPGSHHVLFCTRPGKLPHNELERSTMLSMGKSTTNRLGHGFKLANCECLPEGMVHYEVSTMIQLLSKKYIHMIPTMKIYPPHSACIFTLFTLREKRSSIPNRLVHPI